MKELGEKNQTEKTKTILVVDDKETVRLMLSKTLQSEGYSVVSAGDAESGWKEYKRVKPDLVLTDLKLPGMDGIDLLTRVRQEDSTTPVIIMTAYGTIETEVEALKLGADYFLCKPFDCEILCALFEKFLSGNLKVRRERVLASILDEENKRLKDRIKRLNRQQKGGALYSTTDKYRSIFGCRCS